MLVPGTDAVELRAVSRSYEAPTGTVRALHEVTLSVERGVMVAATGPSGSGKTTLLNLIAGLDRPTAGKVVTLGRSLGELRERELTAFRAGSVGLVFQDPHLLPGLTAVENVIVARLPWRRGRELAEEAAALLDAVGLGERKDFPPALLSGGERQRVGIARALVGHPPLVLADEPTGNLDAAATADLVTLLRDLRARFDLTLVVVTHDPAVAGAADRVIHLVDGRIRPAEALGQAPPTRAEGPIR